jgi:outer membrane protein TolC
MGEHHEPRHEFVTRLEQQVASEVRRRMRSAPARPWAAWSWRKAIVVGASVVVVSMAIGAAAVAAAYQAQDQERRDQLASSYEQRISLAAQRLSLVQEELKGVERQVAVGVANAISGLEARVKVSDAEAQVRKLRSQLEEVRLTSRDPRGEITAPKIGERDFVIERFQIDLTVSESAMALAQAKAKDAYSRNAVGLASTVELETARLGVVEVENAIRALRQKIDVRQRFLAGGMDAVEAELRVLEAEADQRVSTCERRIAVANQVVTQVAANISLGATQQVELAEARLKLLQSQMDFEQARLDLQRVRRQIDQHKAGK